MNDASANAIANYSHLFGPTPSHGAFGDRTFVFVAGLRETDSHRLSGTGVQEPCGMVDRTCAVSGEILCGRDLGCRYYERRALGDTPKRF
jgi:hypothetical protein